MAKVVALHKIDPQLRARAIELMRAPTLHTPLPAGRGMMFGSLLLLALGLLGGFHHANLTGGSPPGQFYNPVSFAIAGGGAYLGTLLIAWWVKRDNRNKRAPYTGMNLVGRSVVIAREDWIDIYPTESADVHRGGPTGHALVVRAGGKVFNFYVTEKAARDALARLQHDVQAGNDPIAALPEAAGSPRRVGLPALLLALPAIPIAIGIDFAINRFADDTSFESAKKGGDQASRYRNRGGRHQAEIDEILCGDDVRGADTLAKIDEVMWICPSHKKVLEDKRAGIFATADASIAAAPEGAREVLKQIRDQSRKGLVHADVVIERPSAEEIAKLDERIAAAGERIAPVGKSFDAEHLGARTSQLKARMIESINHLASWGVFRVDDGKDAVYPDLKITIAYHLVPIESGGQLTVYEFVKPDGKPDRRASIYNAYLGLSIAIDLEMKMRDGASYKTRFAAPPATDFTVKGERDKLFVDVTSVYEAMVDTSLEGLTKNLSSKVFNSSSTW